MLDYISPSNDGDTNQLNVMMQVINIHKYI